MLTLTGLKALAPIAQSGTLQLPVEAWYPYDIEKTTWFWLTYIHQCILGASASSAHIGIDTLFIGLLMMTSHQIDILKHRLKNLKHFYVDNVSVKLEDVKLYERMIIVQHIRYHRRIYRYRTLNI